MIARIWSARTSAAHLSAYRSHVETKVLPVLRSIAGYQGAKLLTRAVEDDVEVIVVTWWTSLDAIRAFAGADVERAVVAEEVRPILKVWDDRVRHYEVAVSDEP
jgi:heme-degrading monooxygenase HmoA